MLRFDHTEDSISEMHKLSETENSRVFELMYSKYSPVIYGIVCKAVGSELNATSLLKEIFTAAWNKICVGEINVSNCFTCLLALTRNELAEFLKSNRVKGDSAVNVTTKNCIELALINGYSLEDIANKLNLSRSEARLELRSVLKKIKN